MTQIINKNLFIIAMNAPHKDTLYMACKVFTFLEKKEGQTRKIIAGLP